MHSMTVTDPGTRLECTRRDRRNSLLITQSNPSGVCEPRQNGIYRGRAISATVSIVICSLLVAGCGSGDVDLHDSEVPLTLTYIDSVTKEKSTGPERSWPFENPKTGQKTVSLALYCPKCQRWHLQPPPGVNNRSPYAARCGKTGSELQVNGPDNAPSD